MRVEILDEKAVPTASFAQAELRGPTMKIEVLDTKVVSEASKGKLS